MKRLALFALLVACAFGQGDILPRNEDTHQNPACSVTGSKTSVKCSCTRMVQQVAEFFSNRCWTDHGWKQAAGPDDRQTYWSKGREFTDAENPPENVKACLAKVPDHCRVVSKVPGAWISEGVKLDPAKDGCGTACRPELCKCLDGACKSHSESEEY